MEHRVGEFSKVSFEQFEKSMREICPMDDIEYDEDWIRDIRLCYESIETPSRATAGSAGYDFKAPYGFSLPAGFTEKVPTGIKVNIEDGWFLAVLPRSSMGFKYRMQLDNTMGVIDSDYAYADNEGHIFIKVTNDSKTDKEMTIETGQAFAQGIFIPFGVTYSDNTTAERHGGIGSTGN